MYLVLPLQCTSGLQQVLLSAGLETAPGDNGFSEYQSFLMLSCGASNVPTQFHPPHLSGLYPGFAVSAHGLVIVLFFIMLSLHQSQRKRQACPPVVDIKQPYSSPTG